MSLSELLAEGDRDEPLVFAAGVEWSRREVQGRAQQVMTALAALGVKPGEPVVVMLPNDADTVAALFGVWSNPAVYVPVNPRLTQAEVDRIIEAVRPAAALTTPALKDRFAGLPIGTLRDGDIACDLVPRPDAAVHDPDVALIQFTSGTTGRPKPVLLLHDGVLTLIDGVLAKLRASSGGSSASAKPPMPNLVPVSLSLWAGIYNVLFAMRVGAPVVLMDRFEPATFVGLVKQFEIRSTVLPPAAMTMLVDDESITDLAPLRFVRSISSPLSPLQARRFNERFGIAVLNSYGQTEIGGEIVGWNAADSRAHGSTKLGSVGRPHEGVEVRISGDAESGELQVRTPAMSAGYADGTDLGDRLTDDGWFRTGDVARIDDDGFIWLEGRLSDMINRGGLKVHPGEVEEVVRLSAAVADVAVAGVADERLGEVPYAFVVPRDGADVDATALEALCREHLAPYKIPARFVAIDELPRNEVGKVVTRQLVNDENEF